MPTTVTTQQSWFSRLGSSIKNIITGAVLIFIAVYMMFWNEKRAVQTYQSLQEGAGVVQSVSAESIDPNLDGSLVHFTGKARTPDVLSDGEFGISQESLRLKRIVEVYQWVESSSSKTVEKLGGGTETTTTYSYDKKWSDELIDSSRFQEADQHRNPASKTYDSRTWTASNVSVGAYSIPETMIDSIASYQSLTLPTDLLRALPYERQEQLQLQNNVIYVQTNDPAFAEVGDTRIRYEFVPLQDLSIIAKQQGSSVAPYLTKNGRTLSLIQAGQVSAEQMFTGAVEGNNAMTFMLRVVAVVMIFMGFSLILGPLRVLVSVIPLLGSIVGFGTTIASILLTLITSCVILSLAWLAARPLLSIGLLFGGALVFVAALRLRRNPTAPPPAQTTPTPQV